MKQTHGILASNACNWLSATSMVAVCCSEASFGVYVVSRCKAQDVNTSRETRVAEERR
jgi:hypothetical protein